jgi:hypothetical protein
MDPASVKGWRGSSSSTAPAPTSAATGSARTSQPVRRLIVTSTRRRSTAADPTAPRKARARHQPDRLACRHHVRPLKRKPLARLLTRSQTPRPVQRESASATSSPAEDKAGRPTPHRSISRRLTTGRGFGPRRPFAAACSVRRKAKLCSLASPATAWHAGRRRPFQLRRSDESSSRARIPGLLACIPSGLDAV